MMYGGIYEELVEVALVQRPRLTSQSVFADFGCGIGQVCIQVDTCKRFVFHSFLLIHVSSPHISASVYMCIYRWRRQSLAQLLVLSWTLIDLTWRIRCVLYLIISFKW
jgi:hypothetical protein